MSGRDNRTSGRWLTHRQTCPGAVRLDGMERAAAIDSVPSPGGMSRRRIAVLAAAGIAATASLLVVAPALADLPDTWDRLMSGDGRWLLAALAFEAVSFLGHIVLFRAVSLDAGSR